MRKILLLEKDENELKRIGDILADLDEKVIVFPRSSVKEACRCAVKMHIDLFIVDVTLNADSVGMPPELALVDKMRRTERYFATPILFITELKDTLLYTYEKLNCYKFIDKPVDEIGFKKVMENSLRYLESIQQESLFYLQWNNVAYRLNKSTVVYIQMIDDKMYIHTNDNKVRCAPYISMKSMMKKLNSSDFMKCYRSTIVNLNYIKSVDIAKRTIQLKDGMARLSIGITHLRYLEEMMGEKV
ncbi:MAG: response regulator transcription factor [Lachnospiraceae bacterium]|nr:response regulator transcription factor [Lachnospiraceae bacterium]